MFNKLIKYLHIIACKEKFIAKQLRYIVLNQLIQYRNILKELINDKDKLFTSNYWKTLLLMCYIVGLAPRMRRSNSPSIYV